ncbi:hypothetical protein C9J12_21135 [Photobacterium frigidiphilum]|uniref:Uncharacterized protein n=1 Tax=Photobacterium frigidiphilum TaxID=264736 RepID=A0A2T3JA75_9GAMM|nr:hypothetical protein [Photobacterium frigidiphilum]PSU45749.1 hypothetical protein C9J12_21135 [Photobacterium frigidiphilum]
MEHHHIKQADRRGRDVIFTGTLLAETTVNAVAGKRTFRFYRADNGQYVCYRHFHAYRADMADVIQAEGLTDIDTDEMEAFFGANVAFSIFKQANFPHYEYIGRPE